GDTVNTASRIESANKSLRTEILFSIDTYEKVQSTIEAIPLGDILLKGKKQKVPLYRLKDNAESSPGRSDNHAS
ncbi:MAG: adenylate/guanylate cyclase domain-containing protein, partial [bacterium]|nr:adenylate/guanylate cyclase domain-containing protein [bacterium]